MIPGPTQIIACPHCGARASYGTLLSGNTFGATVWTDGKMEAPMLPRPPAVVRCAGCSTCYWLEKAEVVGERSQWGGVGAGADAPEVEEPSEAEYYAAIQSGTATNRREEQNLRMLAWWRSNNPCRRGLEAARSDAAPAERERNMRALLALLTGTPAILIAKAELHRELGEWNEAIAALDRIRDRDYAKAVQQLRTLCQARVSELRELELG